jgi:ATP-dependent exoDNAse (exonuclease V) alpha subunit
MILCRTHIDKDVFNEKYKELEKFYILKSDRTYGRGEIYFEKPDTKDYEIRHAFTIHSIQGETAEGNLFINMSGMVNNKSLYTALSRAKYWDQIHLFS